MPIDLYTDELYFFSNRIYILVALAQVNPLIHVSLNTEGAIISLLN